MARPNFLESDSSVLENNLKIVKDDFEDNLANMFANKDLNDSRDCKIVTPSPGMCVKSFKVNTNEKFFINLCQTDGIPRPEDISEDELTGILNSDAPSSYKIPMSISEPRTTTDKSGNAADVCDIAINPTFFEKCQKSALFRDFLIAIILEALSDKYNLQIKLDNWIVLKHRKFVGENLVTHRIQNRDVQTVQESYKNQPKSLTDAKDDSKTKKLIQEINSKEANDLLSKTKAGDSSDIKLASSVPEHRLTGKMKSSCVVELIAEFFLPKCISSNEISLDVGEDRICVEVIKHGYLFDKFFDFKVDQEKVTANFDIASRMLQVRLPTITT